MASIKPSGPASSGKTIHIEGRTFVAARTTASDLVAYGYHLHPGQIVGGPAWFTSEPYDVVAKPAGAGVPTRDGWTVMVSSLLADRFHLAFRRDRRELRVYAITLGKDGPKLAQSAGDPKGLPKIVFPTLGVLQATNSTMADLAGLLQYAVLDAPVVDRTGLDGRYDFTLTWAPDETQFGGLIKHLPDAVAARPDLFSAAQQQAGLKLAASKAVLDVVVIERVERPSAN